MPSFDLVGDRACLIPRIESSVSEVEHCFVCSAAEARLGGTAQWRLLDVPVSHGVLLPEHLEASRMQVLSIAVMLFFSVLSQCGAQHAKNRITTMQTSH